MNTTKLPTISARSSAAGLGTSLLSICLLSPSPARAEAASLSDAQAVVLQTEGPRAATLFKQVANNAAAPSLDRLLARCGLARLAGKPSMPAPALSGDPFADRILGIYRRYWQAAMNPALRRVAAGLRRLPARPLGCGSAARGWQS